ncbi:MAG: hypothetical protein K2K50_06835, partial [Anaeroplasmataceae bacterium]|nr:hypothetical protein [Anaeroplasmataceae bacterium]
VSRQTHNDLIERAKAAHALIAFDPNLRLNLWENHEELKSIVKQYISCADIIKIGLDELEFITGKSEESAVKEILHKDLKVLLVTYGSHGARLYLQNGKSYYNPGYRVQAVDTTGAGDSFFGAFLAEVLDGGLSACDYEKALDIACRCGAYTTTGYGAIPAMGTKEKVVKEIK